MLSPRIAAAAAALGVLSYGTICVTQSHHAVNADEQRPDAKAELQGAAEVIQNDGPPAELKLEVQHREISSESFAVTGSGVVWTIAPDGPPRFHNGARVPATKPLHLGYDDDLESIIRPPAKNRIMFFDQGQWHIVPWTRPLDRRDDNGPQGRIVAGHDNVVLVVGGELTLLIQGTEVIDSGSLLDLIVKHHDRIRSSFGLGVKHPIHRDKWRQHTMIASDSHGHIWCLNDNRLNVLVNGTWIECRELLTENGSRYGIIKFFVPGPDHRYFYIGDQSLRHDGGISFLAWIENGKLRLKPTHHAIEGHGVYPAVCEGSDAVWIGSPDGRAAPMCDLFDGQSAIRIDRNGKQTDRLKMSGYPILSDPLGNMWLGKIRGNSQNHFNIVRDARVVQQIDIPVGHALQCQYSDCTPLFCDKPGSVYVYTVNGLQHMVADGETPHIYRKELCYSLGPASAVPRAYSEQGYCVWLVAGHDVPVNSIYIARLPANRPPEIRASN